MDVNPKHVTLAEHPEISIRKEKLFNDVDLNGRRTKIVCTMGPTSSSESQLLNLLDNGMCVARFNFSHGDHTSHGKTLQTLRDALKKRPKLTVATMLDTKGPEIRTGKLKDGKKVEINQNSVFKITTDYEYVGNENMIACSYSYLNELQIGQKILIADGSLETEVVKVEKDGVMVVALNSATIGEKKNMALPGVEIKLPALAENDINDLVNFGIPQGVDMIAASFVRKASDVREIRKVLGEAGKKIKIVSKIENHEGLSNFEEILQESDAIMVARGDLGMEIPFEKVFIAQKYMIDLANLKGKPIIVATQMLESMITNSRPTRAEITDVANAVLDGCDCVMLSGETANGAFPQKAVESMARICVQAEICINYNYLLGAIIKSSNLTKQESQITEIVESSKVNGIVVLSKTGRSIQLVAKFKPQKFVYGVTADETHLRNYQLIRAVRPVHVQSLDSDDVITKAFEKIVSNGYLKKGDKVHLVKSKDEDNENFSLEIEERTL